MSKRHDDLQEVRGIMIEFARRLDDPGPDWNGFVLSEDRLDVLRDGKTNIMLQVTGLAEHLNSEMRRFVAEKIQNIESRIANLKEVS